MLYKVLDKAGIPIRYVVSETLSPERLWANGMLDMRNSTIPHVAEFHEQMEASEALELYGMDWFAPSSNDDGLSTVEVFDADVPFENAIHERLLLMVNPLAPSISYGIDLFLSALNVVST